MNAPLDMDHARHLMVEQQIRPWEVVDAAVLALLYTVKREDFVPAAYRSLAFVDTEIPLSTNGPRMMEPKLEARLLQEVAVKAGDNVLEVGTGSGYLTALLAAQAQRVTSIEIDAELSRAAAAKLAQAGINNVQLKIGDAAQNPSSFVGAEAQFDVIVLTGSVPFVPPPYLDSLAAGGRLFAVVGDAPAMTATVITRTGDAAYQTREVFETNLEPLVNAAQPSRFAF